MHFRSGAKHSNESMQEISLQIKIVFSFVKKDASEQTFQLMAVIEGLWFAGLDGSARHMVVCASIRQNK